MLRMTKLRKDADLSQAALARAAELNGSTVNAIERGRLNPYPVQIEAIARALGHEGDPAELLEDVSEDASA